MTTSETFDLTMTELGHGRPVLVLHGGGGPFTVATLGERLAATMQAIVPVHPGWDGAERPTWMTGVRDYAAAYLRHLDAAGLDDVLVVGSSLGGWIAAEMALGDTAGRISGVVLLDAVGVLVEGEPITDFFALNPREAVEHTFHDPERFYRDPSTVSAEEAAVQQANMATMRAVAGDPYMHDPDLLGRLGDVDVPTLVVWGASDRIVSPAYGKAYADAFGRGTFEVVAEAGHLPHLEAPEATLALIERHAAATSRSAV
jgi:pimeloyl-ACP methyl ester carboxylesterase